MVRFSRRDQHRRPAAGCNLGGGDLGYHSAARQIASCFSGHRFDSLVNLGNQWNVLGCRVRRRWLCIEAIDVRQQNQQIRINHRGNSRRQAIVVAVTNLVGRHRVIFVDDRNRFPFQQRYNGGPSIQIPAPSLRIADGDQNLPRIHTSLAEDLVKRPAQRDLANRRCGLAFR